METLISHITQKLAALELPALSPGLSQQIINYFRALGIVQKRRHGGPATELFEKQMAMLDVKLTQFVHSRDVRADDISSPEVQAAIALKTSMLPFGVPKLMICVDGRVLSKLFAGLHGSSLRLPAGDTTEFVPKNSGEGLILRKGALSNMLHVAFVRNDSVCEILDSHVGCAARAGAAAKKYCTELPDKGLADDVMRKKQMSRALVDYVGDHYGVAKQILTLQTSFDPHSGYCFMGLEKDECLADPRVVEKGYTHDVLEALVKEGSAFSSEALVHDEKDTFMRDLFAEYYFDVNYETKYRESSEIFWKNIHLMSDKALPRVKQQLQQVFAHLRQGQHVNELTQRAVLMLANAYNAYLHHHDQHGAAREYPYGEHDESVIAITISEKGPYDRARAFSVDPLNPNLSGVIDFTQDLIRTNRRAGRMSATERSAVSAVFPDSADYVRNPVLAIFFERTPETPSDVIIQQLQSTDWSGLAEIDWMNMSEDAFYTYLNHRMPDIPVYVAHKINELRLRATKLHQPGLAATEALLEGRIVPVWTLCGPNRKTIALLPFITNGYTV